MVKDNKHEGQTRAMKDNRSEGQHHGIKEILLNCNCYFVEVGGIKEERCLRRDVG